MESKSTQITISTSTILKTVGILLALAVAWAIRDIILYLFSAMLLAGVMYPFVRWASKYKIPKTVSILSFYLLLLALLVAAFGLLVPAVLTEARSFATSYGESWNWLRDGITHLREASEQIGVASNLQSGLEGLRTQILYAFSNLFSTLTDVFGSIAGFIVVLVLALYIILEESTIKNLVQHWLPEEYQTFAADVTWNIIQRLGDWLRGQLLLGLIIGLLYFVVLSLIGVPYALLLAILGGLLEFIPYIGPTISAIPVFVLALSVSPARAVIALSGVVIIQQLENHFISPKIMQKTVGLNPIVSIVAFMVGAKLFGMVGAIFAIPLATAVSVFLQDYIRFRRTSLTS